MGSCRTTPTALVAAAVVSEAIVAPRKTPCCQLKAWKTSGMSVARRPPNTSAEIGTPPGLSHSCDIDGHWWAGVVKRSEEHTSELQSRYDLVCRLLLEKKK